MSKLTFLLNTCDKHEESWEPFFVLLKKMWPDFDYPIVVNTETKQFEFSGLDIKTVNTPKSKSWSDRLLKVLDGIKTEFVIVFLEDFYIESPVNIEEFDKCFNYAQNNPTVGCISFRPTPDGKDETGELPGYAKLENSARYRVGCQATLWRTEVLRKLLRKHESAWEFEVWGTKRSKRSIYEFYSVASYKPIPFDYNWGKPIYRGHWNLEALAQIAEKTGLEINPKTLPTINNMDELKSVAPKASKWETLKRRMRRIKSMV